jgi:hypothetical protein
MSDPLLAARNVGLKVLRRVGAAHKPITRLMKRRERYQEQQQFRRDAEATDREIAHVAQGTGPIVAGPWLAEVGYEVLYWVPFLRWFQDAYRISPERLTIVSRGGVRAWYDGIATGYVDLFEFFTPSELAGKNEARMVEEEGGGRKQSAIGAFDRQIVERVCAARGLPAAQVLHPSSMFRLFRHVWHGNLAFDLFWTRTRYARIAPPTLPAIAALPPDFIAAKFYTGTALPDTPQNRDLLRRMIERMAERTPVVMLDTGLAFDDHADYSFASIPNVISARDWMQPGDNLAVQSAVIAHARLFLGTCGGLAWLAPFLGTPAIAVYADDRQLAPHLFVARQAGRRAGAADFMPLDVRALQHTRLTVDD